MTETECDTSASGYTIDTRFIGQTLKKNETLLDAGKEADLQANVRKTKCLRMSYRQNAEQNHSIDTVNRLFENVAQFKIWGRKIQTNKNRIKE
jgi:hypothetical protein